MPINVLFRIEGGHTNIALRIRDEVLRAETFDADCEILDRNKKSSILRVEIKRKSAQPAQIHKLLDLLEGLMLSPNGTKLGSVTIKLSIALLAINGSAHMILRPKLIKKLALMGVKVEVLAFSLMQAKKYKMSLVRQR